MKIVILLSDTESGFIVRVGENNEGKMSLPDGDWKLVGIEFE